MAPREPAYRVITNDTMNKAVLQAEYAVRGAIAIRAEELRDDLEAGKQLPFDAVVSCNIGNPQQLDQKPLTYLRQVSCSLAALLQLQRATGDRGYCNGAEVLPASVGGEERERGAGRFDAIVQS
jgi:hypothetical protein